MSLTRFQIREKCYLKVPSLGIAGTADSFAAGSLTDSFQLRNDEYGTGEYIGTNIYRRDRSDDDRIKPAGELDPDTGQLEHLGSDYSNTTAGPYEIVGLVHPDELNDCIRRGMLRIFFPFFGALSPWTDGDMDAADASTYNPQDSGTTSVKSSLAANHDSGLRSLLVPDSGSGNGYTEPPQIYVEPGQKLFHGAVAKVNTAGASGKYQLWDKTNDRGIGEAITFSSMRFNVLMLTDTIPDDCYAIAPRLKTVTASATTCWDTLFGHFPLERRLPAASWLDAPFKLVDFMEAHYGAALETGRYLAAAKRYNPWDSPTDYVLEPLIEGPQPRTIQVNREAPDGSPVLPEWPMWVQAKRPFADLAAMDDETDSTEAPEELVMAAVLAELGQLLWTRYKEDEYRIIWQENEQRLQAQTFARQPRVITVKETTFYTPGGRAGGLSW